MSLCLPEEPDPCLYLDPMTNVALRLSHYLRQRYNRSTDIRDLCIREIRTDRISGAIPYYCLRTIQSLCTISIAFTCYRSGSREVPITTRPVTLRRLITRRT